MVHDWLANGALSHHPLFQPQDTLSPFYLHSPSNFYVLVFLKRSFPAIPYSYFCMSLFFVTSTSYPICHLQQRFSIGNQDRTLASLPFIQNECFFLLHVRMSSMLVGVFEYIMYLVSLFFVLTFLGKH